MAYKIFVNGGYWFTHTNAHFPISKIDTNLFTHLFCGGCVSINPQTYELSMSDSTKPLIDQFSKTIKEKNHEVKTLLSINGSGDDAKCDGRFAAMASDSSNRAMFIQSLISKARESNFDGVDLQWLYPSSMEEMANFEALILECYNDFVKEAKECHKPRLILVATVFYLPYIGNDNDIIKYPIETMRRTLDWANVIAYDIFTPISSTNQTGPSSALFNNPSKATLGGYFGIRTWIEKGMPTKRMIFGLPFHGWAWKLERSYNHNVFSPAQGPAQGQNISMEGLIEYRNIKKFIVDNNNATNVLIDQKYPIAYTHCDNTWIAYESEETITSKIGKVKINLAMLGYFASNIAADDDHDSLAKAASREWRKSYGYYWW